MLGAISLIVDNFESLSRFVAGIDRLHTLSQVVLKTPAAPTPWADHRQLHPGISAGVFEEGFDVLKSSASVPMRLQNSCANHSQAATPRQPSESTTKTQ